MKVSVSKAEPNTLALEAIGFFVPRASKEKSLTALNAMAGVVTAGLNGDFKAEEGEVLVLYPQKENFNAKRVFVLGVGQKFSLDAVRKSASSMATKVREMKLPKVGINLTEISAIASEMQEEESYIAQAVVEGFELGLYDYNKLKTDRVQALKDKKHKSEPKFEFKELVLITSVSSLKAVESGAKVGEVIGSAQSMVRDLINSPSNYMTATDLANAAKASGKKYGYKVTVFNKKKIQQLKMGGLLGVNQGSSEPPTFSILDYTPEGKPKATIALVGKGVTFDTGGISLKPSENLADMKSDMSGAAGVIGAVEIAARLKLPIRVIGFIPATDNKPSGTAQNPGDVLTTYSGITVEVDNTDAEGRLILADALTYAKEEYAPDVIIDLATLTGACVIALGYQAAGLFTNNDDLAEKLSKAGMRSGEKVWRMPLWDDYDKQIKSEVADVKNTGGRGAGAVTAAKFLEKFIGDHKAWAHLDIAGPSFPSMGSSNAKSSSGFGVRLLAEVLRNWN
ncbi:MAG: leucyl aminopeptidase [Chloroherpetonaceae bacterium]